MTGRKHWAYALVPDRVARTLTVPRGPVGWFSGHLMAVLNAQMNREVVDQLALEGDERVLEVGFGPGVGIGLLVDALPEGLVAGIDPSQVMHRLAQRRNRHAVVSGRVDLRLGEAADLPWPQHSFDAVCSANAVQLWDPRSGWASELRRVLRPGGRLVISVHRWAGEGLTVTVPAQLARSGFRAITVHDSVDRSGQTSHVLARA